MPIFQDPEAQKFENPALIKETRKKLGVSQEQLAQRAGLTRAVLANIEAGRKRHLTKELLIAIWDALLEFEDAQHKARELNTPLGRALRADNLVPMKVLYEPSFEAFQRVSRVPFQEQIERLKKENAEDIRIANRVIVSAQRVISSQQNFINELLARIAEKDEQIRLREEELATVRAYYEAETAAALAHEKAAEADERAAEWRAKVSAPRPKIEEEKAE